MGDHSLEAHIVPQVRILSRASYGEDEASYLCGKSPNIKKVELENLLRNTSPRVLVIANSVGKEWAEGLKRVDADLLSFEIYRSDKNKHIFRVHGAIPTISFEFVTKCNFLPYLSNFLYLETPLNFLEKNKPRCKILHSGTYSIWEYIETKDKVFLMPTSANPLPQGFNYELIQADDGQLILREIDL